VSNAQVIGKVAVKVIPDTKGFRRAAQNALTKEEKGLKIEVGARVNEQELASAARTAVNRVNKLIKGKDAWRVRFGAAFSVPDLRQAVNRAVYDLSVLARKEKIEFDADITAGVVGIKASLEQKSLKEVEHELKDWISDISPMQVDIAPTMFPGASTYVAARLAYLTRPRTVEIVPKLNAGAFATAVAALSGARVLNDVLDGIWQRIKRLDKSVPIIGSMAEAFAGLGAWVMTAGSNLASLSMSLAQIGPAALALPGIFGGMAIGLGATVAVLKDFNTVIPEVADKFAKLQDQMSEKFWSVAEAPMRRMINTLFPQLSAGLQQTSTELGGFFANLSNALSGQFDTALTGMFQDLSDSIAIAGEHTDSFVTIIRVLGEIGAGYLPQLAAWFGDISDSFANFLSKAQNDGSLKKWIDTGIEQLSELGRALGAMGGIFAGIAKAAQAGGGSTLTMFADTLERVRDVVNGTDFQLTLIGALQAAHAGMANIANISGPALTDLFMALGDTAQTVFPIMGATIGTALEAIFSALAQPEVQSGLIAMFEGIQDAVVALAPAMAPVGKALGGLMEIVGALASVMGPVLGVALTVLADLVVKLVDPVKQVIELLGGALLEIIEAIAPSVEDLGDTFVDIFKNTILPALEPIAEFIVNLAKEVLPTLIDGVGRVIEAAAPLVEMLGKLFEVVGPLLIPVLKFLAEVLIDSVVMAIEGVVQVIEGVIAVFDGLWQFISGVFTGNWSQAWDGIKQIFSGIWDIIVGAFKIFLNVGILGVARKIITGVKTFFKKSWDDIKKNLVKLWDNLKGSFQGFMNDLKQKGTSILTAIKNFFRMVWNDIKTFIRSTWNDIKNNVSSAIGSVRSKVSSGFNSVKDTISNAMSRAWGLVKAGWTKVKEFFSGGVKDVLAKVKELPGDIKGAFSNAGNWLLDAGKKIIQGLLDGIQEMFGKVKDKLKELTDLLPDWKGPANKDKTLLTGAGQLIIDGFINGLESRYDAVRKSLKGLTNEVAGTHIDGPTFGTPNGGFSSSIAAVVNGSVEANGSNGKTFNYHAAPGSSIDSEEDLFAAVNRARMVGW
jgi:phage-related protein